MKPRIFTADGIREFESQLAALREAPQSDIDAHLLQDPGLTVPYQYDLRLPKLTAGTTRFVWGSVALALLDEREPGSSTSVGFWAWLTAYYLDAVCPKDGSGRRKVGHIARYIPGHDFRTYYRHLLLSPWFVCRAHRNDPTIVRAVLAGPLDSPGDVAEQVISRQELVTCAPFMEALVRLYVDPETNMLKAGAAGSARSKRGGNVLRLISLTAQLKLTYDLPSMSCEQLLGLLPAKEYNRFLRS